MTDELRKRIEEAADEYAYGRHNCISAGNGFIAGAEFGYKEAIAQAKEFAEKYIADWNMAIAQKYYSSKGKPSIVEATMSHGEFCRKLEEHIKKLWEDEK